MWSKGVSQRKPMFGARELVWYAGCALVTVACSSSEDGGGPQISRGTGVCGVFSSEALVDDKFGQESVLFAPGDPITLKITITNDSDSTATLGYDGCPPIRFVVFDRRLRAVVDTLPEGTACTQLLRTVDYAPRETKEFALAWDQTSREDGRQVPSGAYTVNTRDRSIQCAGDLDRTADFTIRQ
jgi:hypothetical protein